jgi:hypothetical protein
MELKEFVKQTIIQITDGIREGHKYIEENNFGQGVNDDKYKEVNFDVAVISNEEATTGVAGKLSVASVLSFGGKDESTQAATNSSRIQFKIYVHVKAGD